MRHAPQDNAMTEIALALAMGFFSIMVLTLISFGAPAAKQGREMAAVTVLPTTDNAPGGAAKPSRDDLVVIANNGAYLGADMKALSVQAIDRHMGRVVLAIDPETSLEDVIEARRRLSAPDLVVVNLNGAWRDALSARKGTRE
jgi:CBS domain-containing protein